MKKNILYDATDHEHRKKSHAEVGRVLQELPEGFKYILSVKTKRNIRSIRANNFYWVVVMTYAIHTGHTKSEIDYMFRMARHFEIKTYPSGKTEKIPKETHEKDTAEFAAILNNLLQWGREEFPDVVIRRREDATYIDLMNVEDEYDRVQSGF